MRTVILAGLRAHRGRLLLTALSIVLGVGFVAGTLTYSDTARAAFYDQFAHAARNVDVAVEASGDHRLPPSALDTVRRVPGVSAADGRAAETLPLLGRDGRLVANFGAAGTGYAVTPHAALRDYTVAAGRLPARTGEIAVDAGTAAHQRARPGDTVTVLDTARHKHRMRLVGTVRFASGNADSSRAVLTPADLATLTGHRGYRQILATASAGVDPATLTARVRHALGSGYTVRTGNERRIELAEQAVRQVRLFLAALLVFGLIALVVSAFVIYNTFTILIAQRRRELALLRCVGASRRQVFGSVLAESALVGVGGSAVGVAFGAALAYGMYAALAATGTALPEHSLVVSPRTVLVAVALGVVVTMLSALLPAASATRVAPIAALRADPSGARVPTRHTVLRASIAVLVAAVGLGLTLLGVSAGGSSDETRMITNLMLVVAGGMVVFVGLVIVSPLFLGRLTALVGWLPSRLFGVPGRLATANARRDPARVAATTTALMIGVALMTIFSVMLATVRSVADDQLDRSFPADYALTGTYNTQDGSVPDDAVRALRARPELAGVAAVRSGHARLAGTGYKVAAVDTAGAGGLLPPATTGSLDDLEPGTIALHDAVADKRGRSVGDRITLSVHGTDHRYRVVATYSGSMVGGAILPWRTFTDLFGPGPATRVMVRAAPGVTPADSRAAVDAALRDYPLVQVSSMAETRDQLNGSLDTMLGVFAALLAISVVIALFGITNTLSLSVFERTRESALLRALGLSRSRLRAMLLIEGLLIALVGAVIGTAFGVAYGAAATRAALSGLGGTLHIPVTQLLAYLALATVSGVLAALLPARRATQTPIIAAAAET